MSSVDAFAARAGEPATSNTLIIRLSSLGDVILSSSSLQTPVVRAERVDWVVAKEYAAVLTGHPSIRKLWRFDRRAHRFGAWYRMCRELWLSGYTQVVDLHGSIRSRTMRVLFFVWSLLERKPRPRWRVASKQRFRSWGYILLKRLWPRRWLSRLQVEVFARTAGGDGSERPDLTHLLRAPTDVPGHELLSRPYLCVMPGSNWPGKTWAAEKYLAVLREMSLLPVVMGQKTDPQSVKLVRLLENAGIEHVSGVGRWSLGEAARVLAASEGYLGSDTGLGLLAEAVGTSITVIYGPTAPGLGFEPWRESSRTITSGIWCQPCGKIGNRCYRWKDRNGCLRHLTANAVLRVLQKRYPQFTRSGS